MPLKNVLINYRVLLCVLLVFVSKSSIAQYSANPLSQAVDDVEHNYLTESPRFFRQTEVSNVGGDAAQSADIGADESSIMLVEVDGPSRVAFDWKVSSERDFDFFIVAVFDVNLRLIGESQEISGNEDWSRVRLTIPAGRHVVAWSYVKDFSESAGLDAGWVDNVVISDINTDLNLTPVLSLLLDDELRPEPPDISELYPWIDPLTSTDGKYVVKIESEPNEQIGGGDNFSFTQANSNIFTQGVNAVGFLINGHSITEPIRANRWNLLMRPPNTRYLPGTYTADNSATSLNEQFLFLGSHLVVSPQCNLMGGEFRIYEISRSRDGELTKLTADATVNCEGEDERVRISVRFDQTIPDLIYTQPAPMDIEPTPNLPDLNSSGGYFKLVNLDTMAVTEYDSSNANISASSFISSPDIHGNSPSQLSFSIRSLDNSISLESGFFRRGKLDIDLDRNQHFFVGRYSEATKFFTATLPLVEFSGVRDCVQSDIESFNIYEADYDSNGVLENISLDFTCGRHIGSLKYRQ